MRASDGRARTSACTSVAVDRVEPTGLDTIRAKLLGDGATTILVEDSSLQLVPTFRSVFAAPNMRAVPPF